MNGRGPAYGWNETRAGDERVRDWLSIREPMERQLDPLSLVAIGRLQLEAGSRVLDIGFGVGTTPASLAERVGPEGEVIGIEPLSAALDVMRPELSKLPNIRLVHGDAETFPFAPGTFDAAFSRFGVMFFTDPVTAFANIRRALRPNGRLSFVCWRGLADNELDAFPIRAATPFLPAQLLAQAEGAGHFSFANSEYLFNVLTQAGYRNIEIDRRDGEVRTGDLQSTVKVCSRVGSLGALLRERPEFRQVAVAALETALKPFDGPGGPALQAATWVALAVAS